MNSLGLSALFFAGQALALNNGVGKLPTMGYDTYNAFEKNYDGALALEQARLMKEYGLVDAGYNTFILDDFYALEDRNEKGEMIPDPEKFPDGMLKWSQKLNRYGLSASAYSSNGYKTCGGLPGAYGHELQDLETWRSWGWGGKGAIVKYDNCYIPYDNVTMENEYGRYERMLEAIETLAKKYKHPNKFIYSLCQWGWQDPHNWAPRISNAWRIDGDIRPYWSAIANILLLASTSYGATDFYQHGDMDMLEVGNSGRGTPVGDLTVAEQRTHFTAWALLKSHLLIGTDLRNATKDTIEILGNKELIAINQDPHEGKAIAPFRIGLQSDFSRITYNETSPPGFWAGTSSYGPVFMIINTLNETQEISFDLTENWAVRAGRQYKVRDMWLHEDALQYIANASVDLADRDTAPVAKKQKRIPVEVFDRVLELLHADSELVSLSQVCRDMNERVTPLIYSHVVIDLSPHLNLVRAEDIEEDDADMDVTMSFNLMAGLANNYRRQCRHVRKLTVRNGYSKASTKGTRWGVPGKGTYFDVSSLSVHSPWVWANMILGMTIPRMPLLSDLVWTAEMPPTNQLFGCLPPGQLRSLAYRFGRDFEFHLTIEWPSKFTPGLRAMKNPSLSSLTIMDIPSYTTDNGFSFLVDNRESLKDLTLKFTEDFSLEDKLLSVVNPIIELQSKLRLKSLHLRNTSCRGHLGWLEAFDFTCIRKFVMFESAPLGLTMPTELWNIFRRTGQRFESLITDCENDEFIEFVESTQGLEQLMLCHSSRSIYNFPKLNNQFDTLKSLFLPQNYPFERQLPYHEEHIFGILSGLQNLKHLFFDRHDDLACGDAVEPTPGSALFIKSFCDFCNEKNAASAVLGRLELIGYFRTLWAMNSTGQIDSERESNQLEAIDGSAQRANYSGPPETEVADMHNYVPVQIGWTDHLDDELVLACHTWVVDSKWDGLLKSRNGPEYTS
ncbi:hypothetical protein V492_01699 [Pseudogymnoascus sp. VKM F-4246]|nr:hypothetical protein V492_01699 [Pseudogymnoascus sp. VKM F-4246]